MKLLFLSLVWIVCIFFAGSTLALSDADYTKFKHESPAFAQADARLNTAWKKLKASLSKPQYQALLEEQRAWLKKRDSIAQAAQKAGKQPLVEIYAEETTSRAGELEQRLASPIDSQFIGKYKNDYGLLEISRTDKGLWAQYTAVGPEGRWTCEFEGPVQAKNDILTVLLDGSNTNTLKIKAPTETLEILSALNPNIDMTSFCGHGGSIEGQYAK